MMSVYCHPAYIVAAARQQILGFSKEHPKHAHSVSLLLHSVSWWLWLLSSFRISCSSLYSSNFKTTNFHKRAEYERIFEPFQELYVLLRTQVRKTQPSPAQPSPAAVQYRMSPHTQNTTPKPRRKRISQKRDAAVFACTALARAAVNVVSWLLQQQGQVMMAVLGTFFRTIAKCFGDNEQIRNSNIR